MSAHPLSLPEFAGKSLRVATAIRRVMPSHFPSELRAPELMGRLAELVGSASGQLSIAVGLVQQVQRLGEPVAWVAASAEPPYPPDLAGRGLDLEALAMVRVENERAMLRCADQLLRSGAFGLVVLDFLQRPRAPLAMQVRLAGLCRQHHCALLCLGPEAAFPMASLRAEVARQRRGSDVLCTVRVQKDKRRGGEWQYEQQFHGPLGMR